MSEPIRILYVDDNALDRELVRDALEKEHGGFRVTEVTSRADFEMRLSEGDYDLVLSDFNILGFEGLHVVDAVRAENPHVPVVMVTGTGSEEVVVEAMKRGVSDYVIKTPKHIRRLPQTIHAVLEKKRLEEERKQAEEEVRRSREQLRNLAARLQSVREEERTRIARVVHDELGQILTVLKMDLSWLSKRIPEDQHPLHEKMQSMCNLLDRNIHTVQRIAFELRPSLLDHFGIGAAIEWEAKDFQDRMGMPCEVTVDPEDVMLEPTRSTALFRIFQETLTNVARHAHATRVRVRLNVKAGKVVLEVRDNGTGITAAQVSDPMSLGLLGMRERVYPYGGKIEIRGRPGRGTTVTVRIPLDRD